jgi:hypothetical protein
MFTFRTGSDRHVTPVGGGFEGRGGRNNGRENQLNTKAYERLPDIRLSCQIVTILTFVDENLQLYGVMQA